MFKIVFNNGSPMELRTFNRNMRKEDDKIINTLSMSLVDMNYEETLAPLMTDHSITSYALWDEKDQQIYAKSGLDGHITSVNENMYGDNQLIIEAYASF